MTPTQRAWHMVDKAWMPVVKKAIYSSRSLPTLVLFDTTWSAAFAAMGQANPSEQKCVGLMQRYYFTELSAEEAALRFAIPGNDRKMWFAPWWQGIQHIQPGSGCGTQPHESWHKNSYKAYIPNLRLTVPQYIDKLQGFVEQQVGQKALESDHLPDVPQEPFPDVWLLSNKALSVDGRTGAEALANCDRTTTATSPEQPTTKHFAFLRSMLEWSTHVKAFQPVPPFRKPPPAAELLALYTASTPDAVREALQTLGIGWPVENHLASLFTLFDEFASQWSDLLLDRVSVEAWCLISAPSSTM